MRLVYKGTDREVKIGDTVELRGEKFTVEFFRKPTHPASSGKVSLRPEGGQWFQEYFVSVIGAEWIEREDR